MHVYVFKTSSSSTKSSLERCNLSFVLCLPYLLHGLCSGTLRFFYMILLQFQKHASQQREEKRMENFTVIMKTPKHSSTTDLQLRDSEREPGMPEYSACNKTMDGHDEQTFDLPSPSP